MAKKGDDLSGADGCMSADEMLALMNNPALLMRSSTGGTVMKTGANRDADGTIDRSPPPTAEVKKLLKEIKRSIDRYGIDMTSEFRAQGATQYGTIMKSRFNSVITITFGIEKDHFWDDPKLKILSDHYGTGAGDIHLGGARQRAPPAHPSHDAQTLALPLRARATACSVGGWRWRVAGGGFGNDSSLGGGGTRRNAAERGGPLCLVTRVAK